MNKKKVNKKRYLIYIAIVLLLGSSLALMYTKGIEIAKAFDRTWSQSDWRGGVFMGVITGDSNTFLEEDSIDTSTEGQVSLAVASDWPNDYSIWAKRKAISITNAYTLQTNYQVRLTIPYDSDMQVDFDDLRFTNSSGTTLDYWLETKIDSTNAIVWVEVDNLVASGDTIIYMYYSNNTATSASSGVNTFPLFDNFDDNSLDPGKWTSVDPRSKITESGGKLMFTYGSGSGNWDTSVYAVSSFARADYSFEWDMKRTSAYSPYNAFMFGWKDDGAGASYNNLIYGYYIQGDSACTTCATYVYEDGNNRGGVTGNWIKDTTYKTRVRMRSSGGAYYEKSTDKGNTWATDYTSTYSTETNAHPAWMFYSGDHEVDNAYVRKWLPTEPISTFSSESSKYALYGTLISNVYSAGYASDWGELAYTSSGNVDVRIRTDMNESMNTAPDWTECDPIASASLISSNDCVNDEHTYIQYQVVLEPSGASSPVFEDISISFKASDQSPPITNVNNVYIANGVENNQWINFEPAINWSEGEDDASGGGVQGYCIALDEVGIEESSTELDPKITSGKLMGIDDGVSNTGCPYIVEGTNLNIEDVDGLALTSNKKYLISIKAVDYAGNVYGGNSETYQDLIWFRYDDTRPDNVMYISTPSSNFGNIDDMFFTWPVSGSAQAKDEQSGILGWQYAINSTEVESWRGTENHLYLNINYIPIESGLQLIELQTDIHGSDVVIGNNTIYFRSIDNSGNYSTFVTGGINYAGAAPTFPDEAIVTINPEISESNEFSINWPSAIIGQDKELQSYYYMINTEPPANILTLKSNSSVYRATQVTEVPKAMLTGAVKGENNVYVVAIDDENNYSPSNSIHGTFYLDSNLPDPALNLAISDTSIKEAVLWRVALTWDKPIYKGNGDISYVIEKSLNGITWFQLDTIKGNAYSDTSSTSREYYYRVGTIDSSNESLSNPSYTSSVKIIPQGRFNIPPKLVSKPIIKDITTRRAIIAWATDRVADSKLQYGLSSGNYFDEEIYTSNLKTEHLLELNNLLPGTVYYIRARWTDEDGNTGSSDEFFLETRSAPRVEDVKITSIGLDYAMLGITTRGSSKVKILYGKTKLYGGVLEINTSIAESKYSVVLPDLEDGIQYHYTIVLTDEEGFEYDGFGDLVFDTPPRPQVSNVQIQEKKGVAIPTVEVFWESNIEVSSIVRYSGKGRTLDKVDMELVKGEHKMEISPLESDTEYSLVVEGVDSLGNRAVSEVYVFNTAIDTRPPQISKIRSQGDVQNVEIQPDRSRAAQLIVSWETDEASTSQVLYGEGAKGDNYPFSTQTDSEMRTKHVIVVNNLSPSKVYHFKVVSKDNAGNGGESGSVTAITPKGTGTVIENVLGSLSRIFGFL